MTEPIAWDLAERIAVRVAGREPFADSYHYASLQPDFDELTAEAEELVAAETGLRSLAGPARARVTDRAGWVRANLASFRRLLSPLTEKLGKRMTAGPLTPVARSITGAEVGAILGWMRTRVLGQYDLLIAEDENPEDQDIVYYVGPNVLALEKRYAFPPREFRLWLALHEVTHRAQFTGVPWMREHFLGLVEPEPCPPSTLIPSGSWRHCVGRSSRCRAGQNPLDEGGLVALIAGPEQQAVLRQIQGMMSLLEGHGDVTMNRAGAGLIPSADRFQRVLHERRRTVGPARLIQRLRRARGQAAAVRAGREVHRAGRGRGGPGALRQGLEGA